MEELKATAWMRGAALGGNIATVGAATGWLRPFDGPRVTGTGLGVAVAGLALERPFDGLRVTEGRAPLAWGRAPPAWGGGVPASGGGVPARGGGRLVGDGAGPVGGIAPSGAAPCEAGLEVGPGISTEPLAGEADAAVLTLSTRL
jgi:hypothetical protein